MGYCWKLWASRRRVCVAIIAATLSTTTPGVAVAQPPPAEQTPEGAPPVGPPRRPLEIAGQVAAISGFVTGGVGTAVLVVGFFTRSAAGCASSPVLAGCDDRDMIVGGAVTMSLGGALLIAGVVMMQVALPSAGSDPRPSDDVALVPRLVGAPGGLGLAWAF